jgi:16S rRNA (uracil1498-N3)-methyltransferase
MIRLYVDQNLAAGQTVEATPAQAHYLGTVMRRTPGAEVALFNGRDGEWRARIAELRRGRASLAVEALLRPQAAGPDLWLLFAPVKRAPVDLIAQKATELGVAALCPIMTRNTVAARVNLERLRANAIEAAEQSGRLDVPRVDAPVTLEARLATWPADRRVLWCDETGESPPVSQALAAAAPGKWAVLIGPEGGFAREELDALRKTPFVTGAGLGPRLLRADTAALAAITCWQALIGDWR